MNMDNGLEIIVDVVFAMSPQRGVIGPKKETGQTSNLTGKYTI